MKRRKNPVGSYTVGSHEQIRKVVRDAAASGRSGTILLMSKYRSGLGLYVSIRGRSTFDVRVPGSTGKTYTWHTPTAVADYARGYLLRTGGRKNPSSGKCHYIAVARYGSRDGGVIPHSESNTAKGAREKGWRIHKGSLRVKRVLGPLPGARMNPTSSPDGPYEKKRQRISNFLYEVHKLVLSAAREKTGRAGVTEALRDGIARGGNLANAIRADDEAGHYYRKDVLTKAVQEGQKALGALTMGDLADGIEIVRVFSLLGGLRKNPGSKSGLVTCPKCGGDGGQYDYGLEGDSGFYSCYFCSEKGKVTRKEYAEWLRGVREDKNRRRAERRTNPKANGPRTKFHADGSMTVWDVYEQRWRRTFDPGNQVLSSLSPGERERWKRQLKKQGRRNPSLGMPGMPHTWVTKDGIRVSGGDQVEYWSKEGLAYDAKPVKRRATVNKMLIFDDHVVVNRGSFGNHVDDRNFIRVVRRAASKR